MTAKLSNGWKRNWKRHQVKLDRNTINHDISHTHTHTFHIQLFLQAPFAYCCRSLVHWFDLFIVSFPSTMLQAHFNVTCKYLFPNFICYRFRHVFYLLCICFFVYHFNIMRRDVSSYWILNMCVDAFRFFSIFLKKCSNSLCDRTDEITCKSLWNWVFRYPF